MRDIVGLHLDPPRKAMLLCVDGQEESGPGTRLTLPMLPLAPGMVERRTMSMFGAA